MHLHKRDLLKASVAIAGLLLPLVFVVWVPGSAGAYERASGLDKSVMGTMLVTPTANPTIAAVTANEQLRKLQLDNDRSLNSWVWNNGATILSSFLSTLVIVIGALIGFRQWRGNQRAERDKQAEGRFQSAVTGLGDDKEGAKIGAAILLRTFLCPGYEQFYIQTFDLVVAHLRLPRTSPPSEDPDGIPHPPEDPNTPLSLTRLQQALIIVFKEAFPLARSQNKGSEQSLDSRYIQLDMAYLWMADLEQVWMPEASLRGALLNGANLCRATLFEADLSGALLRNALLNGARLIGARLVGADLSGAYLRDADLGGAYKANRFIGKNLIRTDLSLALLNGARLIGANLSGALLNGANLSGADLRGADLSGVNIEDASSLKDTILHGVKGLTKKQLEACKAKGAIIDEDFAASSSQETVSPPSLSQSSDVQAHSAPSVQESGPTDDAGGSSNTYPRQTTEP